MNLLKRRSTIDKDVLPTSVLKNSLLIIFLVGIMLFSFFFFVRLKNAINVPAEIRSSQDIFPIFAKQKGVFTFTVKDGDKIKTNETIGYHEQNGDITDILVTNTYLKTLDVDKILDTPYLMYDKVKNTNLIPENLQTSFGILKKEIITYLTLVTIEKEFLDKKIRVLNKKQAVATNKLNFFDLQDSLASIQKKLIVKQNTRDSLLFAENILSADEAEVNRLNLINERKNAIRNYIDRFSAVGATNTIKMEELNMIKNYSAAIYTQTHTLENALFDVNINIQLWENKHLIKAPIDGTILLKSKEIRTPFEANEELLAIIPTSREEPTFSIYLDIPAQYINYVKNNQNIQIKVNEYPFLVYGMVEGTISEIPNETANDYYRCKAKLKEGMRTNYGRDLKVKNRYYGIAQVTLKRENFVEKVKNILTWQYQQR